MGWVASPDLRVYLTQGEGVFAAHSEALERATSGLTRAERDALTRLLEKLGKTAELQLTEEGVGQTLGQPD